MTPLTHHPRCIIPARFGVLRVEGFEQCPNCDGIRAAVKEEREAIGRFVECDAIKNDEKHSRGDCPFCNLATAIRAKGKA